MISLVLIFCSSMASEKDLVFQDKGQNRKLISKRPPFALTLPSEFQLMGSSPVEYPEQNSLTRSYLYMREKGKGVEEMVILQIADKTDPQAEPITVPPLKPDAEKRMYYKNRMKRGKAEMDCLVQLIYWNPKAPSLQSLLKKGIMIPSHPALQGQLLFAYEGEHAVFIKYSRDVHSFGFRTSDKGDDWNRESISGNEKRAYEIFQKDFMALIDSVTF